MYHFIQASLLCVISYFLLPSCTQEAEAVPSSECGTTTTSTSKNKIMALGASRVEGARPEYESYRYELWKDLTDGGWEFDFVGTRCDQALYPVYEGKSFDIQHEGRGGWTSSEILAGLPTWLEGADTPDIVLFSSPGGNDGLSGQSYEQAATNAKSIIDLLQEKNPQVTIIIEQMAPAHSDEMTEELTTFMTQMNAEVVEMAQEKSNETSTVIAVDMYGGFTDALLADEVHYNPSGADFIAKKYFEVLSEILEN